MKKIILLSLLTLFCPTILAINAPNVATVFGEKSGCFIVFDVSQAKRLVEYNPTRCQQAIAPDSTFKIALSLMAFDQNLITQQTVFKWDGVDRGMAVRNQDQTPVSWLKNSIVWVSQQLTPQLGLAKIKSYLAQFNYGNQDFSGDPGKNNGLTHAWLSSSLKISGEQQLAFLLVLLHNQLPVTQDAMTNTKENMYLATSAHGWKLYGKTGSGYASPRLDNAADNRVEGWFVGFVEKGAQRYVFVLNFTEPKPLANAVSGGTTAKAMVMTLLTQLGIY